MQEDLENCLHMADSEADDCHRNCLYKVADSDENCIAAVADETEQKALYNNGATPLDDLLTTE